MTLLTVDNLVVRLGSGRNAVTAVDSVSLSLDSSGVLGVVGESGSGKSTLARAIAGLAPITSGRVALDGVPVRGGSGRPCRASRRARRRIQLVFQDPYASLNPRMAIGESVAEGVRCNARTGRQAVRTEVRRLLDLVRIDPDHAGHLPRQLSGGQRQRVAIARALAARPDLLIADEITSALDASVQGATLNLMREIQRETGIGVLFISHNLAVVRYLADTIAVMHHGRLVESGLTDQIVERPTNEYTHALVSAVPTLTRFTA